MAYLIDSDWVIDHLANVPEATELFDELSEMGRLAISIVTYMEVYEGILRSPEPARAEQQFQTFVSAVPVLPFSPAVAIRCARLRHELRQTGKRVNNRGPGPDDRGHGVGTRPDVGVPQQGRLQRHPRPNPPRICVTTA